ncbi:MAG: 4'-phosphopantetheinyl transferase superfamily protein [Paludibacteraceae bacterium]|nr:4'-phosphopantetheinyl transferase superfamily protein [Paludibacteraceae bacterium]
MEECTEAEVQRMLPLVNAQRREQALRYKHVAGQYCCLKSWLMLSNHVLHRRCLNDAQQTPPRTYLQWAYNQHGKPFIPEGPYFSISHCKEGIAVAVDDAPIGIDIEAIRHADEELIKRTMNEEEQMAIAAAAEPDRMFTWFWTRKEAVVKAQGTGIESFEQLQRVLENPDERAIQTIEKEKYIYSIAYGKLHCFGTEVQTADV